MNRYTVLLCTALMGCESPENACIEDENSLDIATLPTAVIDGIEAEWPGSTILEVEQEGDEFDIEIRTTDGELYEVEISSAGEILEFELEEDHDESNEDEEDSSCDDD